MLPGPHPRIPLRAPPPPTTIFYFVTSLMPLLHFYLRARSRCSPYLVCRELVAENSLALVTPEVNQHLHRGHVELTLDSPRAAALRDSALGREQYALSSVASRFSCMFRIKRFKFEGVVSFGNKGERGIGRCSVPSCTRSFPCEILCGVLALLQRTLENETMVVVLGWAAHLSQ